MAKNADLRNIGVIGSGNFARALAKRLYYAGYNVVIGSRHPNMRSLSAVDDCFCDISLASVEDCIKRTSIIFLAIHAANYKDCLNSSIGLLQEKIIVDVSNRDRKSKSDSNAEMLSRLLPKSIVVKAFNVVSAYAMENDNIGGSRRVFIASDDNKSRDKVSVIARDMGFTPVDMGLLRSSRKIESFPLTLLPEWRAPIAFAVGVFNIWLLYIIFIYFVEKTAYRWDQIFVKVMNKPLCMTAITVLSSTFLPSSVSALFQIFYGTKHIRFPSWLDRWLKSRKQLGMVSFFLVVVHVIMSVLIMSPTYLRSWYQPIPVSIPGNLTHDLKLPMVTWMVWKGEAACLVGIIAFLCLCIIAISTIPSVTDSLNWREWRFIQSNLGHVTLLLSLIHVIIMGAPGWVKVGPIKTMRSITFLSSVLPFLTLFLKLIFSVPCLHRYLKKIRNGWERNPSDCRGQCSTPRTKPSSTGYVIVPKNDSKNSLDEIIDIQEEMCNCHRTSIV